MTTITGPWTTAELAAFLRETTVPMRLSCHRPDGSLWIVALWYRYRTGVFECATAASADLVNYLRNDPSVAFDVSTNRPPYRGVRGNGTVSMEPDEDKAVLGDLIDRYLGDTDERLADRLLSPERDEVTLTVEPRRMVSWDYSARMRDPTED